MSRDPEDLEDALYRYTHGSPPSKARGRVWYDVATIFYNELVKHGIVRGGSPQVHPTHADDIPVTPRDEVELCPVTGKRCYTSAATATTSTKGVGHTTRPYFCDFCKKWHITKETKRRDL